MISYIEYNSETRSFSMEDVDIAIDMEETLKYINGLKFHSKIGKSILPAIKMTAYKYTSYPSALTTDDAKFKARQLDLIKKLKKKVPEVPVILATKFNNACYVPNWDKMVEKWGDNDLKEFCREMGVDYDEVKKNMGPNVVFLGKNFYNAPTLAHEFGHYLNTYDRGEPGGKRAHELYGKRVVTSNSMQSVGLISGFAGGALMLSGNPLAGSIAALISAGFTGLAALVSKPILTAEKSASITGLKLLRSVGISEEEYKDYLQDLSKAFGTYKAHYIRFNSRASAVTGTVGAIGVISHILKN